jgi:DnaJ-class molecular chaperone
LQILSDSEKRSIYDLDGMEGVERQEKGGGGGGGMSPFEAFFGGGGGGRRKGQDAHVEMEVSLEDLYNGAKVWLSVRGMDSVR